MAGFMCASCVQEVRLFETQYLDHSYTKWPTVCGHLTILFPILSPTFAVMMRLLSSLFCPCFLLELNYGKLPPRAFVRSEMLMGLWSGFCSGHSSRGEPRLHGARFVCRSAVNCVLLTLLATVRARPTCGCGDQAATYFWSYSVFSIV